MFMDSSGLQMFLERNERAVSAGWRPAHAARAAAATSALEMTAAVSAPPFEDKPRS
jgi:hypothetical protein